MRFLADENFNGKVLAGLRAELPDLDVIRAQDTVMYQASDPDLLTWAAREGRVLLTHDVRTVPGFAFERVYAGLSMPGVIVVDGGISVGLAIADLMLMIEVSLPGEFEDQVRYIPI